MMYEGVWQEEEEDMFGINLGMYGSMAAAVTAASSYYPVPDMPVDRALLASRNHREAEKRRRERIKSHLDRLRHLLACDPKIDKATLLAKAVQHVRDLKQQTSNISNIDQFPTETDEITVHHAGDLNTIDGNRRYILKASLCCEDRPRLLPELIETLKSLRMRTIRAEMASVGGRMRSVLVVIREDDVGELATDDDDVEELVGFLKEALKAVVEPPMAGGDRIKRRRVLDRDSCA